MSVGTVGDAYTHLSAWSPPAPADAAFELGLGAEAARRVVYEDRAAQSPSRLTIRCLDDHPQPAVPESDDMVARTTRRRWPRTPCS